jgi:hypothetical protein
VKGLHSAAPPHAPGAERAGGYADAATLPDLTGFTAINPRPARVNGLPFLGEKVQSRLPAGRLYPIPSGFRAGAKAL